MDEATSCDSIIMLRDGRMIAQGSPASLVARTKTENLEQAFLALSAAADAQATTDAQPATVDTNTTRAGDDNA
jgi:ABC-2 type transport system ATP-binding protein